MSSPFFSFVDEFLRKKKLPADAPVADKAFHGMLRKQLKAFKRNVMTLIPTFEKIFSRLTALQHQKYFGTVWADHWELVSEEGYDVKHNRPVDYGDVVYNMLLGCICRNSNYCRNCMLWFGLHHFPALRPDSSLTLGSVEMHGDVFKICMAVLRGHVEFENDVPAVGLPKLFVKLCSLCRTVQMLDAVLRTGLLKYRNDKVTKLQRLRPDLVDHPFVQIWLASQDIPFIFP